MIMQNQIIPIIINKVYKLQESQGLYKDIILKHQRDTECMLPNTDMFQNININKTKNSQ